MSLKYFNWVLYLLVFGAYGCGAATPAEGGQSEEQDPNPVGVSVTGDCGAEPNAPLSPDPADSEEPENPVNPDPTDSEEPEESVTPDVTESEDSEESVIPDSEAPGADSDFTQCGCSDTSTEGEPFEATGCVETLAGRCTPGGGGLWRDFGQAYMTVLGSAEEEAGCEFSLLSETEGDVRVFQCTILSGQAFPLEALSVDGWVLGAGPDAYQCALIHSCNELMDEYCTAELKSCRGAGLAAGGD